MEKERIIIYKGKSQSINEFLFSNLHLGIFDNEVLKIENETKIRLMVFNRLDMILDLSRSLIAN
ncbi:MAG TPA: hypothetical protein PLS94_14055 [Prolixibacteraceae bacterium]|nr:hypothetical protein [Prolixibacteraceae bacterium]HPR60638.1 hypothetical protein [Prolixibacteraceae bacterium]